MQHGPFQRSQTMGAAGADGSLVAPAVEESLRFDANFGFGIPRYLSEPIEVAGASLPTGTTVVCNVSAANRDGRAFESNETMNLSRSPNPHLIFGVGQHSCIGQALARVELQVALDSVVTPVAEPGSRGVAGGAGPPRRAHRRRPRGAARALVNEREHAPDAFSPQQTATRKMFSLARTRSDQRTYVL